MAEDRSIGKIGKGSEIPVGDGNAIFGIKKGDGGAAGDPSPLALAFEINKRVVGITRENFGRNPITDTLLRGFVGATEGAMSFVDKITKGRQPQLKVESLTPDEATALGKLIGDNYRSGNFGRGPSIFGDDGGKRGR